MSRSTLIAAAALAAIPLTPVLAEVQASQADPNSITVLAPYVESKKRDGTSTERRLTASSIVYIEDLNLRTAEGREELQERVQLAAEETCAWLDDLYPLDSTSNGRADCVRSAVRSAENQMQAAFELASLDY